MHARCPAEPPNPTRSAGAATRRNEYSVAATRIDRRGVRTEQPSRVRSMETILREIGGSTRGVHSLAGPRAPRLRDELREGRTRRLRTHDAIDTSVPVRQTTAP